MAHVCALVIGSLRACGGGVTSMGMVEGCSASSPPPLGEIRPRIMIFITMVLGQVLDVEDIAYIVLVTWNVDLAGIVVVACEHLEGSIGSRKYLGLALLGEAVLPEM